MGGAEERRELAKAGLTESTIIVPSPTSRTGRPAVAAPSAPQTVHAPHAALLIDFDNVTLGIRSDLTKELKTLLNSDIIRGKVAVQRAYADWRRYPQYIVPLSERSIDLIFATAVGSTKKNATDIRLAIDAMELVFTRPEIGTFILLSGDSDFSALVIKLKEYGKYVVGVGIRESASDMLIQNCDEYYSYTELAGLNREVDTPSAQRDPWELVKEAVQQMVRQGDVMRSDRLKQVMQQLDSNFDERNAGFNRFSKFVTEAGNRGLLRVSKLDNGQYEVGPAEAAAAPAPKEAARDENGRGRGRGRRGRGRDRDRKADDKAAKPAPKAAEAAPAAPAAPAAKVSGLTLGAAFALMGQALEELGKPVGHEVLRARMAALHGKEDPLLDAGRFSKLLRQANDAEVADVRKLGEDDYEVAMSRVARARRAAASTRAAPADEPEEAAPSAGDGAAPAEETAPAPGRTATLRYRRGSRGGTTRPQDVPLVGVVSIEPEGEKAAAKDDGAKPKRSRRKRSSKASKAAKSAKAADSAAAESAAEQPAAESADDAKAKAKPKRRSRRKKATKAKAAGDQKAEPAS